MERCKILVVADVEWWWSLASRMADETVCCVQNVNDGGEDSDEFSVDRRDRTSEAGTSGSGSDEDEVDEEAHYFSDVRERMGEPSTSGREHRAVLSPGMDSRRVINTVEVKAEVVEGKVASSDVGLSEKVCPLDESE